MFTSGNARLILYLFKNVLKLFVKGENGPAEPSPSHGFWPGETDPSMGHDAVLFPKWETQRRQENPPEHVLPPFGMPRHISIFNMQSNAKNATMSVKPKQSPECVSAFVFTFKKLQ